MSNISQNLINAMGIIAEDAVKKAGYDKTIQVQILSCLDQAQGKYRCRFQDAIFYAYSNNPLVTYTSGSFVYVLVPGNNMSGKKNIVGSTQLLGVNYIPAILADEYLDPVGINCVLHSGIYYLNSDNKDYKYDIYSNNHISLDNNSLNNYIKRSSYILLGANFKTNLSAERQYRGHFGITFKLVFNDNATGALVVRTFTINLDNMVGNPYRLLNSRQYLIFPIDGANFVRFAGIEIFNSDFPNANGNTTTGLLNIGDISILSIEIQGANKLSLLELNGVAITFYTPNGTFFNDQSLLGSSKQITAQIRIKGKLTNSEKIPFYWGILNIGITPNSVSYNKYLGRGWKCLNNFNTIVLLTKLLGEIIKEEIILWIPNSDTYYFKKEDAIAKLNKIRVAILYLDNIIHKLISIQNLSNNISNITIESDEGETFYLDFGTPSLTCKVDDVEQLSNNYEYFWGMVSNTGMLIPLNLTTLYNNIFLAALARVNVLKAQSSLTNAEKILLEEKLTLIKDYNFIQRVNKNKVIKVQINTITNFAIFKCSVYKDGRYLGTGSIKLVNLLLNPDGGYNLIIENGSAVFKYDENGAAPNNKSLLNPIEIKALDFILYDSFGLIILKLNIIGVAGTEMKWLVPIVNTMIEIPSELQLLPDLHDLDAESLFYSNVSLPFVYQIASKYNSKKQNNQIKLHLKYKNISMIASTQFMFMKLGLDGSNGTEYVVKILPNTTMSNPPLYPIITKTGSSSRMHLNYNIGGSLNTLFNYNTPQQLFKAQLWHSGELIWEGSLENDGTFYNEQNIDNNTLNSITWEVLSNKYGNNKSDNTLLLIDSTDKNKIKLKTYSFLNLNSNQITSLANIIKCTIVYNEKLYYATMPVIFAWVDNDNYRFYLKENSGYRYVVYSQDGQSPQYDSSEPFEFIYQPKTQYNVLYPNIDLINRYTYLISIYGDTQIKNNNTWLSLNSLQLTRPRNRKLNLQKNQFNFIPAARYDGLCVNNGIVCTCKEDGVVKARIYVPIHFYLNRYVFSHLNGWDGNSIQINELGGYILSPQMGAGTKDLNNGFTGVLMGEVKDPNKGVTNSGLLGYHNGTRTFFVNSENGSAIFGKSGNGQLIIDPQSNKAMLYSSNYWKTSGYDEITGLPKSYGDSNKNKQGLLIDLTTPKIEFGNGNFSVDLNGYLIAVGGGEIAGWKISESKLVGLYKENNNVYTTTLHSAGKIYSNEHNLIGSTSSGFYLGKNGLSMGSKLKITPEGILTIGRGAVNGSSNKHWTINGDDYGLSYIKYNNKNDSNSVYLGTDGIWLGKNFSVTNDGTMTMRKGSITLGYADNSSKGFSVDSSGSLSIGTNFSVTSNGNLSANNVELSGSVKSQKEDSYGGFIELKSGVLRGGWNSSTHGNIDFTFNNSYDNSHSIMITAPLIRFNSNDIGVYNGTNKYGEATLAASGSLCGISFINGIATVLNDEYGYTGYINYIGTNGSTAWLYFNNGVLTTSSG